MHLLQLETREYIFLVNWHQSIKCRSNANLFIVEFQFTISFLLTLLVLHISTVQNREMEVHCEHQMTSKYVEILVYGSPVLEVKDLIIQGILSHGMISLLGILNKQVGQKIFGKSWRYWLLPKFRSLYFYSHWLYFCKMIKSFFEVQLIS